MEGLILSHHFGSNKVLISLRRINYECVARDLNDNVRDVPMNACLLSTSLSGSSPISRRIRLDSRT